MKEEKKAKNKKKILFYYLILAACLLVIAAVTLTVVFTVGMPKAPQLADTTNPAPDNGENNKPDDGEKPDDKPTVIETGYKLPVSGALTDEYEFVWKPTIKNYSVHLGLDFAGNVGDEVCAVNDGEVTAMAKTSTIGETFITIKHADGLSSTYRYVDAKDGLKVGSKVKRGEVIGTIAEAGGYEHEKGVHLHLEFTDANGKQFDPATKLYDQK